MHSRSARVLMVYLEPAPYIVGLIDAIRSIWEGEVDVVFIHDALTQPWDYDLRKHGEQTLPHGIFKAIRAIRQLILTNGYSSLHLAGWGHPVLLGALALGAWFRLPVTVETDTQQRVALPVWKRISKQALYRQMFKLPAVFLPAGSRQAAYLRHYGVEEGRIRIARMTVDVNRILSFTSDPRGEIGKGVLCKSGIPEKHVKFLYVGRLEPGKGLEDLAEAFRLLTKEFDCTSLVVVGDGSLRQLFEGKTAESMYYLGRLSGDDLWEMYAAADVFVLPSHAEQWGLVVNEAMAAGLPVIVTDRVGCVDDLVQHRVTGLIVPAASPDQLFNAMKSLVDPYSRRRLGSAARNLISDWTLENSAGITIAAWRMAIR